MAFVHRTPFESGSTLHTKTQGTREFGTHVQRGFATGRCYADVRLSRSKLPQTATPPHPRSAWLTNMKPLPRQGWCACAGWFCNAVITKPRALMGPHCCPREFTHLKNSCVISFGSSVCEPQLVTLHMISGSHTHCSEKREVHFLPLQTQNFSPVSMQSILTVMILNIFVWRGAKYASQPECEIPVIPAPCRFSVSHRAVLRRPLASRSNEHARRFLIMIATFQHVLTCSRLTQPRGTQFARKNR